MTPDPAKTILLMEDDSGVVRLEQDRLERSGYRVVTAVTAKDGLEKISDGTVALIVLLEKLRSGDSGLEFFKRVKAAGHHIPAILVTVAGDEKLLAQAIAAGVRDLVPRTEALSSHLEFIVTRVLDQECTEGELAEARIMARAHEARSRELEEEMRRLLAELEAERVLLKDVDQRKDQFLAVLAHELRNPLAPISNAVQIMKVEGSKGPNFRWSLEVIESQIKQMTHLIDDLLDVSRITRGKVVLQKQPVTLGEVVELAIEASQPVIQEFRHHLDVALPPEPVTLRVDVARISQVLSNLLNNAARYTNPGGEIRLAAEVIDHEIEIRVHDNGIGIAPELLPKIFDLFVQGEHTPSRPRGGLGIGLTLVRSLVEQHEGRVVARSDGPGQGTEVVVRLPFDASSGAADLDELRRFLKHDQRVPIQR